MKILVTGAAGFIGFHTCMQLLGRGDEVVGIDNLNDYYSPELKRARLSRLSSLNGFHFALPDIANGAAVGALFTQHNFDRVVHLAAQAGVRYSLQNPQAYVDSNLTGFVNVLEACRRHRVQHLVYASSSSVYGGNVKMPFSENDDVDRPVSLYAVTKKANELMAHAYGHLYELPTTGLRLFTVYGPWGRPDMAYFLFTKAILEGHPIDLFNHGNMKRDFTYVDDIVEAVVRVLDRVATPEVESKVPYRLFNVGNQDSVSLGDFVAYVESALGRRARKRFLPMQDKRATSSQLMPTPARWRSGLDSDRRRRYRKALSASSSGT
jgi:UDP-glucuronate 4-epimerase